MFVKSKSIRFDMADVTSGAGGTSKGIYYLRRPDSGSEAIYLGQPHIPIYLKPFLLDSKIYYFLCYSLIHKTLVESFASKAPCKALVGMANVKELTAH